jgi:recombination protein RecA
MIGSTGVASTPETMSEGIANVSQANLRLVEGSSVDKTKALDAALSQIERSFGKGSIMRLGRRRPAARPRR